jgi:hypothetical protein
MAIIESAFDNEKELEAWAFDNVPQFLGDCVQLGAFQITTYSGKKGVPDGYAFNFKSGERYLISSASCSSTVCGPTLPNR